MESLPLPEMPDHVTRHMQELNEIFPDRKLNLREVGLLFIALDKEYKDEKYLSTAKWLSMNYEHFDNINDAFFNNAHKREGHA